MIHEAAKYPRGRDLFARFGVVANTGDGFSATLTLENRGTTPLPAAGWEIYCNFARQPKPGSAGAGLRLEPVNGDLVRLAPSADFEPLLAAETRRVEFVAEDWAISRTDAPSGFFIVFAAGTRGAWAESLGGEEILPFLLPEQRTRGAGDRVPSADPASRFERNRDLSLLPEDAFSPVTPTPYKLARSGAPFTLEGRCAIGFDPGLDGEAAFLESALAPLTRATLTRAAGAGEISLRLDGAITGYRLGVRADGIAIVAGDAASAFHAIQTLLQLLPIAAWEQPQARLEVPGVEIEDHPRFAYRGLHLDVARNFSDKATVLRVLDLMALYKLNTLHFHLTDDEGWRVEIATLPELTEIGGRRGFTPDEADRLEPSFGSGPDAARPPGSGHYSRADFIEILSYAAARHIEIIPELDLPGHGRAAIVAMRRRQARLRAAGHPEAADQFVLHDPADASRYRSVQGWRDNVVCIGRESVFAFVEAVIGDLVRLYREAGLPLRSLHTGGDEVPAGAWEGSPLCLAAIRDHRLDGVGGLLARFNHRLVEIGRAHGIAIAGWEEMALAHGADGKPRPDPALVGRITPYVWNNVWGGGREDMAYRLANAGFRTVLCNVTNLYLDFACEKDPAEPGYYWGGFIDTRQVYEFCPLDIFTTATTDAMGRPLDRSALAARERLTPDGARRIAGIQAELWGENLSDRARLEYMLMPRLIAVAERAWAADPGWTEIAGAPARAARMAHDWNEFANRLGQRELPRLDHLRGGIAYRIPVPGAVVRDGRLEATLDLPGLKLRYTTDGTDPTAASADYAEPVAVPSGKEIRVAAVTSTGRAGRAAAVVA